LGLRQRLSLAVAVIHAPEILILDEPTSASIRKRETTSGGCWICHVMTGDNLHFDPFHGRGDALRSHLAYACRKGPGYGHPSWNSRKQRRGVMEDAFVDYIAAELPPEADATTTLASSGQYW